MKQNEKILNNMRKKRTQWVKTTEQEIGDYGIDQIPELARGQVQRHMNVFFRRLVSCRVYGLVLGHIEGKKYSPSRVNMMARRGMLNYFKFSGIMFILMTDAEYDVYVIDIKPPLANKEIHSDWRRWIMRQPKTREESENVRRERLQAVLDWESGKYKGEEWDKFFLGEFAEWVDGFEADSVGIWLAGTGYFANPDSERGIRTKETVQVGELWGDYKKWCKAEGYVPKYIKQFSISMADAGFGRRFMAGQRHFDLFVADQDVVIEDFQVQAILLENEAKLKAFDDEKKKLREISDELKGKMEVRLGWEKDTVWLAGVVSGEYEARKLFGNYEAWCRERMQQPLGRKLFYAWLVDMGLTRETKSGILFVTKS